MSSIYQAKGIECYCPFNVALAGRGKTLVARWKFNSPQGPGNRDTELPAVVDHDLCRGSSGYCRSSALMVDLQFPFFVLTSESMVSGTSISSLFADPAAPELLGPRVAGEATSS